MAWDGKHVGMAYYRFVMIQDQNIHFVLLNADGSVVPSSDRIIAPFWTAFDVVSSGSEYAIAYDDGHLGTIVFQRLDAAGKPKASALSLTSGSIQRVGLAWSKTNGYYVAYGPSYSDGDASISNWTVPLGADGTTPGTPQPWGFGGRPFASNLMVGGDGTLGVVLDNGRNARFLTMDPAGRTILPVAQLTQQYAFQTGAVGYDPAGYFEVWPLGHSIFANRGMELNEPVSFVDIGVGNSLRDLSMAHAAGSVALGWTWTGPSASVKTPSTFTLQRFSLPDAKTGVMQAITDAVDLTKESTDDARIISTGPNSLLAVWSNGSDLYAMPIDFNSCP